MRQTYVKMGLVSLGKEERSKMRQKCVKIASKMRQQCAEHLWGITPFGRYRIFVVWEQKFQLNRTSVTQGLLAGMLLCNSAPS